MAATSSWSAAKISDPPRYRHKPVDVITHRLLEALEQPIKVSDHTLAVSACLGTVLARGEDTKPAALVANADSAMYRAERRSNA